MEMKINVRKKSCLHFYGSVPDFGDVGDGTQALLRCRRGWCPDKYSWGTGGDHPTGNLSHWACHRCGEFLYRKSPGQAACHLCHLGLYLWIRGSCDCGVASRLSHEITARD